MQLTTPRHTFAPHRHSTIRFSGQVLAAAVAAVTAIVVTACSTGPPDSSPPAGFRPTASVQDLMLSIVDPAADTIWESVATIVTHEGIEERRPRTEEDWEALRHEAVRLVETSNLLLMDGRDIARPGFRSEHPGIELEPEEIQALIDDDPESWKRLVGDFYRAAATMLSAVENRDADRLFDEGGPLNETCERCHQHYWYPGDKSLQRIEAAEAAARGATGRADATPPAGPAGTIQGHIRLSGKLPGNPIIRMGVDPLCAQLAEGKQIVQESVLTSPDGSLANVVVRLEGAFPETPVPDEPVVIEQVDCVFVPRVVGVRAGQLLRIKNSDPLLHNLHSQGSTSNRFNRSQPVQGGVYEVRLAEEEGMLRIRCDLHRWMTEYIAVLPHPYFAVTGPSGTFTIAGVPLGTHTIQTWHEKYGVLTQTVSVEADGVTVADFTYPGAPR